MGEKDKGRNHPGSVECFRANREIIEEQEHGNGFGEAFLETLPSPPLYCWSLAPDLFPSFL